MLRLGGALKRREKISGRLADALAWLYLGSAVLKRFCNDGQPAQDRPLAQWAMDHALIQVEQALCGVIENMGGRATAALWRFILLPLEPRRRSTSDAVSAEVARALLQGNARQRLTREMYVPPAEEPGLGHVERAFELVVRAAPIESKLRHLVREGRLDRAPMSSLADHARDAGLITATEHERVVEAEVARRRAIEVDAFDRFEFVPKSPDEPARDKFETAAAAMQSPT
jgi:acyl-CoA dehydrogenase